MRPSTEQTPKQWSLPDPNNRSGRKTLRVVEVTNAERLKRDRGARIYVDSVMTTASAYSIRLTPTATIPAPVTWEEHDHRGELR